MSVMSNLKDTAKATRGMSATASRQRKQSGYSSSEIFGMAGRGALKVDPSVSRDDLVLRGEPQGSVPMETTMRKPLAYREGDGG